MRTLLLLVGCSGSGKSTLAAKLRSVYKPHQIEVCSADDKFLNEGAIYQFDASQLGEAHRQCRTKAERAMRYGIPLVVVDNTNLTASDLFPYVALGERFDYEVRFKVFRPLSALELAERNVHGVPMDSIVLQQERLKSLLGSWPETWPKFEYVS